MCMIIDPWARLYDIPQIIKRRLRIIHSVQVVLNGNQVLALISRLMMLPTFGVSGVIAVYDPTTRYRRTTFLALSSHTTLTSHQTYEYLTF